MFVCFFLGLGVGVKFLHVLVSRQQSISCVVGRVETSEAEGALRRLKEYSEISFQTLGVHKYCTMGLAYSRRDDASK